MTASSAPYEVVATEAVIQRLLSDTEPGLVEAFLSRLRSGHAEGVVTQVEGALRPLWSWPVHGDVVVCGTVGVGASNSEEVRLVHAGAPPGDRDVREVLAAAGEPVSEAGGTVVERLFLKGFPAVASARLPKSDGALGVYAQPERFDAVEELLEKTRHEAMGELQRGRFRHLTRLCLPDELPVRLGPRQVEVLDSPTPLLLQGLAGSGKTTILCHFAARRLQESPGGRLLVVVFEESLRRYMVPILAALGASRAEVITFRALCEKCATAVGVGPLEWSRTLSDVAAFLQLQRRNAGLEATISLEELLDEIRACIKGRSFSPSPIVDEETYLGWEDGVLHASPRHRKDVYRVARALQHYLGERKRVDDIDAARILWGHRARLPRWDWVLVDEAQDYTLNQLALLATLAESPRGLVFAGDALQTVHASQFSWRRAEEAVQRAHPGASIFRAEIDTNYRNPGAVAMLGDAVLSHRAERLGLDRPAPARSNQPLEPRPLRALVDRRHLKGFLVQLAAQIPSLGVVFPNVDDVAKNQWKFKDIEFRRGFCPQSAKGIEFEVCCLVDSGRAYSSLGRAQHHETAATTMFGFNKLYVSLSRPRRLLILLDVASGQAQLWDDERYWPLIESVPSGSDLVARALREVPASSPVTWGLAAWDFEVQEANGAAAECWLRAEEPVRAARCFLAINDVERAVKAFLQGGALKEAATLLEGAERWAEAADCWHQLGQSEQAAACFERADRWEQAAEEWTARGDVRAHAAWARHYERSGRPVEASIEWERFGDLPRATHAALRAGQLKRGAELLERLAPAQRPPLEAELLEATGSYAKAAASWEELSRWDRAAGCFWLGGEEKRAFAILRRLGAEDQTYRATARFLAERGRHEGAADFLSRIGDHREAAKQWSEAGQPLLAARAFERAGEIRESGRAYGAAGRFRDAASAFARSGFPLEAAEAWAKAGEWVQAAEAFESAGAMRRSAFAYAAAGRFREASRAFAAAGDAIEAAEAWMDARRGAMPTQAGGPGGAAPYVSVSRWERREELRQSALCAITECKPEGALAPLRELVTSVPPARSWLKVAVKYRTDGLIAETRVALELAGFCLVVADLWRQCGQSFHENGDLKRSAMATRQALGCAAMVDVPALAGLWRSVGSEAKAGDVLRLAAEVTPAADGAALSRKGKSPRLRGRG